jgi:hypothetical protein
VLMTLAAGPAFAQGPKLLPSDAVDPASIRFVTAKAASSDCIGLPRTPMCGIDTAIGCWGAAWNVDCARYKWRFRQPDIANPKRVEYVVLEIGTVNRRRLLDARIANPGDFKFPSTALQARVLRRECDNSRPTCAPEGWEEMLYTLWRIDVGYKLGPRTPDWSGGSNGLFSPGGYLVE